MTSPALLTKELEFAMAKLRRGLAYDPGKYRGAPDKRHIPGLEPEEAAALLQHIAALEQQVEAADRLATAVGDYNGEIMSGRTRYWNPVATALAAYRALPKEPR